MGTYGDGGNVKVLLRRAHARGLAATAVQVNPGDAIPEDGDLYVLGGGEDASQVVAARELRASGALSRAAQRGAAAFAVCAGMQVLGHDFEVSGGAIEPGLGLLDATTRRRQPRAVGEVLAQPLDGLPLLTGYENHGGGTSLGPKAQPLAKVVTGVGNGGGESEAWEGIVQGRVLATYLHGPVLARNPELADLLLELALASAEARKGRSGRLPSHPEPDTAQTDPAPPPGANPNLSPAPSRQSDTATPEPHPTSAAAWPLPSQRLAPLETPFVAELRAEREAYARSGRLSAESARTKR
jgi:CobQ-like glutamine amidotransferase family enzyme